MSLKYPLNETLSPIDREGRNRLNDNWSRIMAYFDHVQLQIKALAGGHEVDELIARLEQAIANAETDLQNYIAQVDTTVQEAIDANNTATQNAINANNQALQTALNTIGDVLTEVSGAIQATETATNNAVEAKDEALQAAADAQTTISQMQVIISNFTARGEWNATTDYFKNNLAGLNGKTYIALQNNTNKPVTDTSFWMLFADRGAKGEKGEKGDPGTGIKVLGHFNDASELPLNPILGDAYTIGADRVLYVYNGNDWQDLGSIKGVEGKSAYEVAVENGFVGTEIEWLESLKGGIGPPGPDGPQGPPGKDADLTEVNQEIANIKQTVTDNKAEVTEHLGQDVLSEDGAHGIRYFNDKLETKNGTGWSEIEIGKPNTRGTQSFSPYHAIRRFPVFNGWANNETAESLWLVFKDMALNGQLIVRGSIGNGVTTANAGGFEYSLDVFRLQGSTSNMSDPLKILYYSDSMNSRFNVFNLSTKVDTKQPVLPITKRQYSVILYIEIEYISANTDAFEALDSIEFELQVPQASPSTAPRQQSIFTHVGNSKEGLAIAITGKGVQTSKDDTFATMIANIDAIPSGGRKAEGTSSTGSAITFIRSDGGNVSPTPTLSLPHTTITLPFEPSHVFIVDTASGAYKYVVTYRKEQMNNLWLGSSTMSHATSNAGGSTTLFCTQAHITNVNGIYTCKFALPTSTSYTYKWVAYE